MISREEDIRSKVAAARRTFPAARIPEGLVLRLIAEGATSERTVSSLWDAIFPPELTPRVVSLDEFRAQRIAAAGGAS